MKENYRKPVATRLTEEHVTFLKTLNEGENISDALRQVVSERMNGNDNNSKQSKTITNLNMENRELQDIIDRQAKRLNQVVKLIEEGKLRPYPSLKELDPNSKKILEEL